MPSSSSSSPQICFGFSSESTFVLAVCARVAGKHTHSRPSPGLAGHGCFRWLHVASDVFPSLSKPTLAYDARTTTNSSSSDARSVLPLDCTSLLYVILALAFLVCFHLLRLAHSRRGPSRFHKLATSTLKMATAPRSEGSIERDPT